MVINEVASSGPSGPFDEFVEVRNVCDRFVDVSSYELRGYDETGLPTGPPVSIPSYVVLLPRGSTGEFLTFVKADFSGTVADRVFVVVLNRGLLNIPDNGGLCLFDAAGRKVDCVGMGVRPAVGEGPPAQAMTAELAQLGAANARDILSTDTDHNQRDFSLHRRSAGAVN
ncbi:lamin tail domain-containing protein [Amycolatopsis aidingensis]|uniref:lamin tail domain-containing protein n=1 Tax=Amycolatopsis aidingensis TaxID=2842453 RepID=UPI001C0B3DDF|nr:lamin tail domain-containing protein [Amycolatopsis aidingensis]